MDDEFDSKIMLESWKKGLKVFEGLDAKPSDTAVATLAVGFFKNTMARIAQAQKRKFAGGGQGNFRPKEQGYGDY